MIWSKEALEREIHFGLIIGFSPSLYSPEETIAREWSVEEQITQTNLETICSLFTIEEE